MSPLQGKAFAEVLVQWQKRHGRQTLPWQHTGDAYKVWLSEIMLQQTQVATVLAYYTRFLDAYPTVRDLAAAPEQDVMQLWAGLGYYTRARNLHACAKQVVDRFDGQFPRTVDALESLPGIGRSTAGAIASLAHGVQASILDGNVKRVFCRYYGVEGYPEQSAVKQSLWKIADANVPQSQPGVYNQALMDLGAICCTPRNPNCGACPLMSSCAALRKGMVGLLPTPKPKKERPMLYFLGLIVQDARRSVLLELQTAKGVWQSLWVVPMQACDESLDPTRVAGWVDQWVQAYGLHAQRGALMRQVNDLHTRPWLVHELTHRKMHFKALRVDVPGDWPQCHSVAEKPVPKIVHKLLSAQASVPQQNTLDL